MKLGLVLLPWNDGRGNWTICPGLWLPICTSRSLRGEDVFQDLRQLGFRERFGEVHGHTKGLEFPRRRFIEPPARHHDRQVRQHPPECAGEIQAVNSRQPQ